MDKQEQQTRFDTWLQEHGAILHHIARGFAAGDDVNDLIQELLLAMWKAIPAFRDGAKASTFIYRVAHNAAMMWQRGRSNYRRRMERYQAMTPPETDSIAGGSSSEDDHPDRELLERLYAGIRRLPALDRSLILLSLEGVSYRDMAEIHGLSESNAGVRLNRAKHQLAASMKHNHHEL